MCLFYEAKMQNLLVFKENILAEIKGQ